MKMRKITSLLMAMTIAISSFAAMATTSFAMWVVGPKDEKPVFSVEVTTVTATKAKIAMNFAIDSDLVEYSSYEDEELDVWHSGKGLNSVEVRFKPNPDYFVEGSQVTLSAYKGTKCNLLSDNSYSYAYAVDSPSNWITEKSFTVATLTMTLTDTMKARYNALLAENGNDATATKAAFLAELNAKTDLVAYEKGLCSVQSFPAGGTKAGMTEDCLEYYTKYRWDGNADYLVTLKKGADAPDPTPAVPEVDGGALDQGEDEDDKTWNVNISNGFVAAGDVLVATLTNSAKTGEEATQVVELKVGEGAVAGGADWSFKLKVRFFDLEQRATTSLSIAKKN